MMLGEKILRKSSVVPDQSRIRKFQENQTYLLNISSRADRVNRADPLVSLTSSNRKKYLNLESSCYGQSSRNNQKRNSSGNMESSILSENSSTILFGNDFMPLNAVTLTSTQHHKTKSQPKRRMSEFQKQLNQVKRTPHPEVLKELDKIMMRPVTKLKEQEH